MKLSSVFAVLFALLSLAGLMSGSGITGHIVAGCDCIGQDCLRACDSGDCCVARDGTLRAVPGHSPMSGYLVMAIGLCGFFAVLWTRQQDA